VSAREGAALPGAAARDGSGLDAAVGLLTGRRLAIVTGAGISTDSGIPDYRGEGAPVRTPMTFQEFLSGPDHRRRYWAGSQRGWRRFAGSEPNAGHYAVARLEAAGVAGGVITQNVDGLHRRAGSSRVVELHGTADRVRCLDCGRVYPRGDIAGRIAEANPWFDAAEPALLRPDGDAEVGDVSRFRVPDCSVCGGILKPDVVFFGELVPQRVFAEAASLLAASDALLIAGSSLAVNSAVRLLGRAVQRGLPVVIVNRGATKGDDRATIKLDAGTSETLSALAERLAG